MDNPTETTNRSGSTTTLPQPNERKGMGSEEDNAEMNVQDHTDLTTLIGPKGIYKKFFENCFTDEEYGNVTWGEASAWTQKEFSDLYGTTATRRTKLRRWIAFYKLQFEPEKEPANAPAMAPGVDQTDSWAETVSAPLVELPLAKNLRTLLESHPQQKAPIESAVLTSWEGRVAKTNLAPFFAASTQNCCVVLGYEISALLLSPQPVVGENEDGCHGLIDQCVAKPLKLFAPEFRLSRNSSQDSSSYPLKRPDFSATVVGKGCFFRGEEKKMDSNENPAAELHEKLQHVWPFPGIPFVLGYWSVGTSIHFCKVSKDNSEEIVHYELSSALGKLHCWNAIRNGSRLMKYMASTYMSLVPNDMVDNHLVHTAPTGWTRTIKYSGGHVLKEIALRDGETQQKLNRVLAVLDKLKDDSNSIQGVLPIIKYNLSSSVNDNEKRRRVQPCLYIMTSFGKACSQPSNTLDLTFLVRFLLETVRSLHKNGITHRDIRLPNILQDLDDNYGLVDWDDSVVGLENLPNNEVAHLASG